MIVAKTSRVLVCGSEQSAVADVCQVLDQAKLAWSFAPLTHSDPDDLTRYQMLIVDGTRAPGEALQVCQRWRQLFVEEFLPILYLTENAAPAARQACLEAGAHAYILRPFAAAELLMHIQNFTRIKERHERLIEKTAEIHSINKRLQKAYHQIDQELELASRIQESFLPQRMPDLPQVRFAVHYKPCGRVGGDFYDIMRLDEQHLGFYVADAMGHGVPASLLTIFVKKGIRTKEINGKEYRLLPPGEVLQKLNRDLIEQCLSETPFITMVYSLFNYVDGTLRFARAGHPYPLHIPAEGPVAMLEQEGTLLGVFDTNYSMRTCKLQPGDKVLLYTDGVDTAQQEHQPGGTFLRQQIEPYRHLPIRELVEHLAQGPFAIKTPTDDLTLLGIELVKADKPL